MGTMPLFRPNTGMKMKLWSLKYAPNTAVAVVVKEMRIRLTPNTITDPMHCITMEGAGRCGRCFFTVAPCQRMGGGGCECPGSFFRFRIKAATATRHWPATVATAAPPLPAGGSPAGRR